MHGLGKLERPSKFDVGDSDGLSFLFDLVLLQCGPV